MKTSKKFLALLLTGTMALCLTTNVFEYAKMPEKVEEELIILEEDKKGKRK